LFDDLKYPAGFAGSTSIWPLAVVSAPQIQPEFTPIVLCGTVPIIAVTSYALSGEEKKARAAGCDGYVPKPFSRRQLLAKIRQYLQ
jgi:CheY-like chemotaxis protein